MHSEPGGISGAHPRSRDPLKRTYGWVAKIVTGAGAGPGTYARSRANAACQSRIASVPGRYATGRGGLRPNAWRIRHAMISGPRRLNTLRRRYRVEWRRSQRARIRSGCSASATPRKATAWPCAASRRAVSYTTNPPRECPNRRYGPSGVTSRTSRAQVVAMSSIVPPAISGPCIDGIHTP